MNNEDTMSDDTQQHFIIPTEEVVEQRQIDFLDDTLILARTTHGIYISVPGMCKAIGLGANGQIRRMVNTNKLRTRLRTLSLLTRGGQQQVTCIDTKAVPMWLIGVESSKAKPVFQAKIDRYYDELEPLAERVFADVMGTQLTTTLPSPTDPRLAIIAEHADLFLDVAIFLQEHMDAIGLIPSMATQFDQAFALMRSLTQQQEETHQTLTEIQDQIAAGLTKTQRFHVAEAVSKIVTDSASKSGELTHAQIYAALKRRFQVASYGDIPPKRYEEVMAFLRDLWKRATIGTTPEQKSLF